MRIISLSLLTFSIFGANFALGKGYHGGGYHGGGTSDGIYDGIGGGASVASIVETPVSNNNEEQKMEIMEERHDLLAESLRLINVFRTDSDEGIAFIQSEIDCDAVATGSLPFNRRRENAIYNVELQVAAEDSIPITSVLSGVRLQLQRTVAPFICEETLQVGLNGDRITNVLFAQNFNSNGTLYYRTSQHHYRNFFSFSHHFLSLSFYHNLLM